MHDFVKKVDVMNKQTKSSQAREMDIDRWFEFKDETPVEADDELPEKIPEKIPEKSENRLKDASWLASKWASKWAKGDGLRRP